MTRGERYLNLTGLIVPFLGVIAAVILTWNSWVDGADLALLAVGYLVTAVGVTVGLHRLLTHRAFSVDPWLQRMFARLGQLSAQGAVLDWVADHRKHHAFSDIDGDPHSPHLGPVGLRGLLYAHGGWLLVTRGQADWERYAPELFDDPRMLAISRNWLWYVLASLLIPTALGWVIHSFTWQGALRGYVWGGLVRIFLVHHVTWSINSLCHVFGTRPYDVPDRSTNLAWLAIPSLGEAWHNNHHAFPRSARHGLGAGEIDVSALIIAGLVRLGLARDVLEVAPERQAARRLRRSG